MTPPECWFCSEEIGPTERSRVVADLSVVVHAGCFDRIYETEGPRPWSADRRPADRRADGEGGGAE